MCKHVTNVLQDVQQWSIMLPLFCLIMDFAIILFNHRFCTFTYICTQ